MLRPVAEIGSLPRWELVRNTVSQEAPVPGRALRRRRSVHVSHSSFAALERRFTIRPTTSSRNAGVAGLLNSLESQVTPELLSPIYSRSVPARPGCVRYLLASGRRRHHSLEGSVDLVARDASSASIGVGVPVKPP